jgi:hypothetical protein
MTLFRQPLFISLILYLMVEGLHIVIGIPHLN